MRFFRPTERISQSVNRPLRQNKFIPPGQCVFVGVHHGVPDRDVLKALHIRAAGADAAFFHGYFAVDIRCPVIARDLQHRPAAKPPVWMDGIITDRQGAEIL